MTRMLLTLLTATLGAGTLGADTVPVSRLKNTGFVAHGSLQAVPRALLSQLGDHLAMRRQNGGTCVHVGGGYVLTARHVWRDLSTHYPGQGHYVDGTYLGRASLPEGYRLRLAPEPGSFRTSGIFLSADFGTWNDWALLQRSDLSGSGLKLRSAHSLKKGEPLWAVGDRTGGMLRVTQATFNQVKGVNGYAHETEVEAGFSGGAVIDAEGRLVGVIAVATSGGRGCVFITTDTMVKEITQQRASDSDLPALNLKQTGVVGGLGGQTPSPAPSPAAPGRLPSRLRTDPWIDGVRLVDARDSLQNGDVLTRLGDHAIRRSDDVGRALKGYSSGSGVTAVVLRGAEPRVLTLTFGAAPGGGPRVGARIDKAQGGAVVLEVMSGGPAASAGLLVGDLVVGINNRRTATLQAALDVIRGQVAGHSADVRVLRGGSPLEVTVTLD